MNTHNETHVMVDLETLDTAPTSAILAIGAVPFKYFDSEPELYLPAYYEKISSDDSFAHGFTQSNATMEWWMKQRADVRAEAFSGTRFVMSTLLDFAEYLRKLPGRPIIWGNGSDFDNVILANAYRQLNIVQPWDFRDNRCYRTLKSLHPEVEYTKPARAHCALEDARAQANHAEAILYRIETLKGA